jgi:hypothetical protein
MIRLNLSGSSVVIPPPPASCPRIPAEPPAIMI